MLNVHFGGSSDHESITNKSEMDVVENLQVGSFVDVLDRKGKWYASEVRQVLSNGDIHVHFLSWNDKRNETIPAAKVESYVAPLYAHSLDRNNWEVGDSVDYLCSARPAKRIWMAVPIVAIDYTCNVIAVQLFKRAIEAALLRGGAPKSAAKIARTVEWFELLSEEIAPLNTHTTPTTSTTGQPVCDICTTVRAAAAEATKGRTFFLPAPPAPLEAPSTWLAPLLRDLKVSEQHIIYCERALVLNEGFTDAALFASLNVTDRTEMYNYLNKIGITAKGVQLNVYELHKSLQALHASE